MYSHFFAKKASATYHEKLTTSLLMQIVRNEKTHFEKKMKIRAFCEIVSLETISRLECKRGRKVSTHQQVVNNHK